MPYSFGSPTVQPSVAPENSGHSSAVPGANNHRLSKQNSAPGDALRHSPALLALLPCQGEILTRLPLRQKHPRGNNSKGAQCLAWTKSQGSLASAVWVLPSGKGSDYRHVIYYRTWAYAQPLPQIFLSILEYLAGHCNSYLCGTLCGSGSSQTDKGKKTPAPSLSLYAHP